MRRREWNCGGRSRSENDSGKPQRKLKMKTLPCKRQFHASSKNSPEKTGRELDFPTAMKFSAGFRPAKPGKTSGFAFRTERRENPSNAPHHMQMQWHLFFRLLCTEIRFRFVWQIYWKTFITQNSIVIVLGSRVMFFPFVERSTDLNRWLCGEGGRAFAEPDCGGRGLGDGEGAGENFVKLPIHFFLPAGPRPGFCCRCRNFRSIILLDEL